MPKVNPKILVWARETAGLTQDQAAKKLGVKEAYEKSASERLNTLENGEREPTRPMILKMVKWYRRPLLTFYMSLPPRKGDRGQDFRTLPEDYSQMDDFLIDTLIRNVRARQSMLRAVLEEEEDVETLKFVGSAKLSDGLQTTLNILREILKIDLNEFRSKPNSREAFSLLRYRAETAGIFVLLIGDLGSHHTTIDVGIFRGFALADNLAPFIIINSNDLPAAWSFTLIHELVHILLGQTGISGEILKLPIEQFCNQVASEFLVTTDEINQILIKNSLPLSKIQEIVSKFASERNISSTMVAYRLYRIGKIDFNSWDSLKNTFRNILLKKRLERRKKAKDSEKKGGPSYYLVRKHRLGNPLLKLVQGMMAEGSLSTSKAGKVLGVKAKNVQPLLDTI